MTITLGIILGAITLLVAIGNGLQTGVFFRLGSVQKTIEHHAEKLEKNAQKIEQLERELVEHMKGGNK